MPPPVPACRTAVDPRRGAALPFALLALLILSLLASALLLASSTDVILSRTHRETVEELYAAEGAVNAWIAARGPALSAATVEPWTAPNATVPVRIRVERMADAGGLGWGDRSSLFAVHAEPLRGGGGRGVVALMRVRQSHLADFSGNVDAAIVASEHSIISATTSGAVVLRDGTAHPHCPGASNRAASALLLARDKTLALPGGAQLEGGSRVSALHRDPLLQHVLGNVGMRDLAWNATARFGRYFNEPPFAAAPPIRAGQTDPRFRWGCPADVIEMVRDSASVASAPYPCPVGADTSAYTVVAIDAEQRTVVLDSHHAQGILIVLNGALHLRDRFVFKGLILAEGDVRISGGGDGWPPSVEGAVVAGGRVVFEGGAGERSLRFNRCAIERAQAAFNGPTPGAWGTARLLGRPHAWMEITQ
jgi:hypothetical protein